jgi:hypothetical protein
MSPVGQGPGNHWHLTRDIKPRGECGGCDVFWRKQDERLAAEAEPYPDDRPNPHLRPEDRELLDHLRGEGKLK